MSKYRIDREGDMERNGSIPCYADWMGGPTLSAVKLCPVIDRRNTSERLTAPRTVYVTGEADTYFSIPAMTRYCGLTVKGWIGKDGDAGYIFHVNHDAPIKPAKLRLDTDPNAPDGLGTRRDCTRDNEPVYLPCASTLGYGISEAVRGCWILYERDNYKHVGRVVGRVHNAGQTYMEVMAFSQSLSAAYVRWIDPCEVKECRATPPASVMQYMLGEWTDAETVLRRAMQGFVD